MSIKKRKNTFVRLFEKKKKWERTKQKNEKMCPFSCLLFELTCSWIIAVIISMILWVSFNVWYLIDCFTHMSSITQFFLNRFCFSVYASMTSTSSKIHSDKRMLETKHVANIVKWKHVRDHWIWDNCSKVQQHFRQSVQLHNSFLLQAIV